MHVCMGAVRGVATLAVDRKLHFGDVYGGRCRWAPWCPFCIHKAFVYKFSLVTSVQLPVLQRECYGNRTVVLMCARGCTHRCFEARFKSAR